LRRLNSDMDKIFDLFLYLFPKYLDKISDPRNNRYTVKRSYIDESLERDAFQVDKIENSNKSHSDKNADNNQDTNNSNEEVSEGESVKNDNVNELEVNEENLEELKENKDVSKGGEAMPDAVDAIDTAKEDTVISEVTDETTDTGKNEPYNICVDGIEKILIELVGEKVDICITNPTMFLLNAVTILNVADDILKLRTSLNTIIVIPIEEIVAIRCKLIYGINFENNCNLDVCKKEEGLRRYFASIIGKKVSLQTKGEGEFKYISNRIVTGAGKGIVIIEGTIAISLSKITLVEEIA
jgi:hypothetical protein